MNRKSRQRVPKGTPSQPMVETLEGRALMSATAPVVAATGDASAAVGREPQRIIGVLIALVKTNGPAPIGGVHVAVGDVNGNSLMEEEGIFYY